MNFIECMNVCTFVWCYRERKYSTKSVAFGGCIQLVVNQPLPHLLNCHLDHRYHCHQLLMNWCYSDSMNFCDDVFRSWCAMWKSDVAYLCPVSMWIAIDAVIQQWSAAMRNSVMFVHFHHCHYQLNHHQQNHRTLAIHCCRVHYDYFDLLSHAFHWPQLFHTMHLYSAFIHPFQFKRKLNQNKKEKEKQKNK